MSYPVYTVYSGDVLPVLFDTFDGGTGASCTLTGLAVTDIEIYKDGSTTQRASDAGYTLLDTDGIDFDSITGIHGFSIDTGDNTDAGFYAVGSWYHVVVSSVTVDSQTVNFIACAFRIMAAETTAGVPKVDVHAISNDTTAADNLELMFDGTGYAGGTTKLDVNVATIAANAITATAINADAITSAKIADNAFANEHFADGALTSTEITSAAGCIVASIANNAITAAAINADAITAAKVHADVSAEIADAVWDEVSTGHTDAGKAGQQLWTDVDAILADTNELQVDDTPAALAAIDAKIDTIDGNVDSILTDTGTTLDTKINTIDTVVDLVEDILRNKMEITDANGNTTLYADNNSDALYTVAACVTDNSTTTTRKRLE